MAESQPQRMRSSGRPASVGGAAALLRRLDRSDLARRAAGTVGEIAGFRAGLQAYPKEAGEDLASDLWNLGKLIMAGKALKAARESLASAVEGAGAYAEKVGADPGRLGQDIMARGEAVRRALDPSASPMAASVMGEARRVYGIGRRQGRLAGDVAMLVAPGAGAKALEALTRLPQALRAEKYVKLGFSPEQGAHLAEPYPWKGHHFVPKRTLRYPKQVGALQAPEKMAGKPLPKAIMDSPFNLLKPSGMDRFEMYQRHFQVDPRFHGTGVLDGGWSGKKLGIKRYGPVGRVVHGSPTQLKAVVLGPPGTAGVAYSTVDTEGKR